MERFSLVRDDPLQRWLGRLRLAGTDRPTALPRIVVCICLTWCSLAFLAWRQGLAVGPSPRESFLYDLAAYAQFLLAVPLFILAEGYIDAGVCMAAEHFRRSGLLHGPQLPEMETAIQDAARLRKRVLPELICVGLAYVLTWGLWLLPEASNGTSTWHALAAGETEHLTLAGWWAGLIAVPVFHYHWCRWLWKTGIWCSFLRRVSKLQLHLAAAHPDHAGGLGFLGQVQTRFAVIIFAFGTVVAAIVGHKLVTEGASFSAPAVWAVVVSFVLISPVVFLMPLLMFTRQLYHTKQRGLREYGALATRIGEQTEEGLFAQQSGAGLDLDRVASLLSHLAKSYAVVKDMRVVPFDMQSAVRLLTAAGGPMLPLLPKLLPALGPVAKLIEFLR